MMMPHRHGGVQVLVISMVMPHRHCGVQVLVITTYDDASPSW